MPFPAADPMSLELWTTAIHALIQLIAVTMMIAILPVTVWSYFGTRWVFWTSLKYIHTAVGQMLSRAAR